MAPEGCGWRQVHPQGNLGASGLQILNLRDSAFLFIALAFAFPPGEGERSAPGRGLRKCPLQCFLLSHTGLVCLPGLGTTTRKSGLWCTRMAAGLSNLKLAQEVLTTMRGTGRAPFRAGFARPRFGRSGRALNFVCKERGYV